MSDIEYSVITSDVIKSVDCTTNEKRNLTQILSKQDLLLGKVNSACLRQLLTKSLNTISDPKVIKLFSYSTQLSMKFILLINVKMSTIDGILTFISMINATYERLKARNFFICRYFSFYEQLKFRAWLS